MDATTVFNVPLQEVNEQLFYAVDYPAMLKVVNEFVRKLISKSKKPKLLIDDATVMLLNSRDKMTVEAIAREACLSTKQLDRKFKERSGVNPKVYERIIRFDKAFRLKTHIPAMTGYALL